MKSFSLAPFAIKSLRALRHGLWLVTLFVLFALVGQLTNIQTAHAGSLLAAFLPRAQAEIANQCSLVFDLENASTGRLERKPDLSKAKVGNTFELKFEDPGDGLTQVREEYKQELKKLKWTSELQNLPEVREQCSMEVCHAMVWLDYLEYEANRNGMTPNSQVKDYVSIDPDYLAMKHWERATETMIRMPQNPKRGRHNRRFMDKKVRPYLEQSMYDSWKFIGQVGLIPDGIVSWKLPFKLSQHQERTNAVLQSLAAQVRMAAENESIPLAVGSIFDQGVQAGLNYLHKSFGDTPLAFKHEGKIYDPKSFLRSVFPFYRQDITMTYISYHKELDAGTVGLQKDEGNLRLYALNKDAIEVAIRSRISSKKMPIPLTMDIHNAYLDRENAVFTINGWSHSEMMKHPNAEDRRRMGIPLGGHAVLIVGYIDNPKTGRIDKLKIKNSWGSKAGNKGYFIVDMDYFYEFGVYMAIPGDPMIPFPDLVKQN